MVKASLLLNASTKRKQQTLHQTQALNATTKRKQQTLHQTQALMGATRLASGIKAKAHTPNKGSQTALITRLFVNLCLKNPDAGRVAPIRGSV